METKKCLFSVCGNDLIKYDSENDWAGNYFNCLPNSSILKEHAGIYVFKLCGEIVYVGSSINLFNRMRTHIISIQHGYNCRSSNISDRKYYYLNKYISNVEFQIIATYDKRISKHELESYEYEYMNQHCPIFNVNHKYAIKKWIGTDQDIDNFVKGTIPMNVLKNIFKGEQQ